MVDLVLGALPVLAAEGVERQAVEPQRLDLADQSAHRLDPALVADRAWQMPPLGPAAIAIHDDRDMARTFGVGNRWLCRWPGYWRGHGCWP